MTAQIADTMNDVRREAETLARPPAEPPATPAQDPAAEIWPLGIEPGGEASRDLERQKLERENAALRDRVSALEHENRRLAAEVEAARVEGGKAERELAVRTMHGRLPSILTGGL